MPTNEACEKCGEPATVTYHETCCTGQFIDCTCGGQPLPVHLCARCEIDYLADQQMIEELSLVY